MLGDARADRRVAVMRNRTNIVIIREGNVVNPIIGLKYNNDGITIVNFCTFAFIPPHDDFSLRNSVQERARG